MAYFFAAGSVANMPSDFTFWVAIWGLFGALTAFVVKLIQLLTNPDHNTRSPELLMLGWIGVGSASAILGLLLGLAKIGASTTNDLNPAFPGEATSMLQVLLTSLFLATILSFIAAYSTQKRHNHTSDQTARP
jgi:hypothetical protein